MSLETSVRVLSLSLGPHCFIVPVRDEHGRLHPGVTVVDMMHKEGEFAGGPAPALLCPPRPLPARPTPVGVQALSHVRLFVAP